jgi:hypothetical protein
VNTAHRSSPHRRAIPSVALIALVVALAACHSTVPGAGGSSTPSASTSTGATPSAATSASGEPTAQPSDDLGPFACSFPVTGTATVNRAQLVDVRVGTHAGYDRVVFEFAKGVPAFTLDEATPPLVEDASGRELDVAGNAFWQLVMRDASRADLSGKPMFTDTDFNPGFPKLTELIEGGDFEAVSTWYFGLDAESCVRVLTLKSPSRLVLDIQH